MTVVPVHAFYLERLAVEIHDPVLYPDIGKAHGDDDMFFAAFYVQLVQLRRLVRPELRRVDCDILTASDLYAVPEKSRGDGDVSVGDAGNAYLAFAVSAAERSFHVYILNMSREHNGITFPNLVASLKTKYTDSTTEEIAKFTEEFLKQLWQEGLLVE